MDGVTISESAVIAVGGYARTLPGHIYFPKGSFDAPGFVPWLIHELTHVWQYQHDAPLGNVIVSAFKGNYDYGGEAGLRKAWADGDSFGDFGFEQQGDILQHYYQRLGGDTSAFDPFLAQVRSGWISSRLPEVEPIKPLPAGTLDLKALNERYRARIEAEIVGQLRRRLPASATKAILERRDRVLELFRDFRGYWAGTYLDRIAARAPGDELMTLLYRTMSDSTIGKIRDMLSGKTATKKTK